MNKQINEIFNVVLTLGLVGLGQFYLWFVSSAVFG